MRRTVSTATALFAAAGFAATATAAAVNFAGSNSTFAGNCNGADASLAGSGNSVTIRGACRALQIAGDDNRVLVDMAPEGTIKVYGSNNKVSWTSRGEVDINTAGPGNTVSRAR